MSGISRHGIGMTSQRTRDRLINRIQEEGIQYEPVIEAMKQTPRHLFMDEAMASRAYEDTALPIGQGQTISQPYIVARMTEALLDGLNASRVLEIGTGSGYQTAILAQLVEKVYTVERIRSLLDKARRRLRELNYHNIEYMYGDGYQGWEKYGPYDGILVTAAPERIPDKLKNQLAIGGRLIIPAGDTSRQALYCITRTEAGFDEQQLEWVSFVPLLKGEA